MDILGLILFGLGALGTFVFGIWLLVTAFQKHVLWGLAYIFLPFAAIVYVCMNWNRAAKPFLLGLLASALMFGGIFMSPTIQSAITKNDVQSDVK